MIRLDERQRDDIIEALLEFRSIIGPEMAFRAAKNRTDDHIQALEEVIWKNREPSTLEKDIRVHHIIGLASANILYLTLLNFFNKFVIEYGHLYFNDEENVKRSERFHEEIYQAIKKGNAGLARKIMWTFSPMPRRRLSIPCKQAGIAGGKNDAEIYRRSQRPDL